MNYSCLVNSPCYPVPISNQYRAYPTMLMWRPDPNIEYDVVWSGGELLEGRQTIPDPLWALLEPLDFDEEPRIAEVSKSRRSYTRTGQYIGLTRGGKYVPKQERDNVPSGTGVVDHATITGEASECDREHPYPGVGSGGTEDSLPTTGPEAVTDSGALGEASS